MQKRYKAIAHNRLKNRKKNFVQMSCKHIKQPL